MKLHIIDTGYFKLDGGAMFGVVPKRMWNKLNPADENNMCTWAMRCLLVEDGDKKILIDTGMGDKQDDKFKSHFEPHGDQDLISSLNSAGFEPSDITDVFLTHLHFDHCGGAVSKADDGTLYPTFSNATYWSNQEHWTSAIDPNPREKASFLKENILPLEEAGVLKFIEVKDGVKFSDNITVRFSNCHTKAMMIPWIDIGNGSTIVYAADLLPSSNHVSMPYVMSYDLHPLLTLEEKKKLYDVIADTDHYIFFEHDKDHALGKIVINERGRYKVEIHTLDSVL